MHFALCIEHSAGGQKNTRAEGPARVAKKVEQLATSFWDYDARAAARLGAATTCTALIVLVIFERDAVRAMLRALTMKHFSSAWSTRSSTATAFSRITSEISEMISALARSSIRFSRNDRLFDLIRKVRLLSTSAMS